MEFVFHKELNTDIWEGTELKPEIREKLLAIAQSFYDYIGVEFTLIDVIFTGSLANYNYTSSSDIDLHLVYSPAMEGWKEDGADPVIKELFDAKKSLWNEHHDIEIKGHPVEVYLQDSEEAHFSTGVYSLVADEWLLEPSADEPEIDMASVHNKAESMMVMIDKALSDEDVDKIDAVKKKIKVLRQSGLEKDGQYSVENLAFKTLRNSGYLEKLSDAGREALDKELSLESAER